MASRVIPSTCSECLVRCGSLIHMEDEQVVRISGNPDHPGSRGAFCVKGVHGPMSSRLGARRITHPMRRTGARGQGQWERITWQTACSEIADRLGEIKTRNGALSIAGAVSNHTQSKGIAVRLLLRSLGSPNLMINQDLCHGCRATASLLTGVTADAGSELSKAKVILVVGKSPSESHVVDWMRIKAARAAGATLIVVDPRRTALAKFADHWLAITPGTDAALALSMIQVVLAEGLIDAEFVADHCSGTEALRERTAHYPPEIAATLTGIEADTIRAMARVFAGVRPAAMVLGHGIDAQANGVDTAMAFQSLLALTGNIDRPGTNRLARQMPGLRDNFAVMPEFRLPRNIEAQTIGAAQYPLWSGPDSWARACHNPAVLRAVHSNDPYPVRAMYLSGANILCSYPDMQRTKAALEALDLIVVAADQLTPTAEMAEYFLPKTTLLEEEDVFMDQGGPCLSFMQKVLPPLGEARSDIDILISLYQALHERGHIEHELVPWQSHAEFTAFMIEKSSVRMEDLRKTGFHRLDVQYESWRASGFKTPSGKIEFESARRSAAGLDPTPDFVAPSYGTRDDGFDLILFTGVRSMAYQNTRFREHAWARRLQDAPELRIHPATAAKRGIAQGDWVWVQTRADMPRCLVKARITDEVTENTVATGMGWWYPEISETGHGAETFNIGVAVPYGPHCDPVSGSAEARNTACRIERADKDEVARLMREVRSAEGAANRGGAPVLNSEQAATQNFS